MPARKLPDKATLRRWLAEGLSHQEIADRVFEETGVRVKRSSVGARVQRLGLAQTRHRYEEELPWRVRSEHLMEYAPRMLRDLGRRRRNLPLTEDQDQRLTSWLKKLEEDGAVVVYLPETEEGFHYVKGTPTTEGVPIMEKVPRRRKRR